MPIPSGEIAQLEQCLQRLQAGDSRALNDLLRQTCARLRRLARKMLGNFPSVRSCLETDDLLQNLNIRLLNVLKKVQLQSPRHFFSLAAEQMRWELLDLARYHRGLRGSTPLTVGHPGTEQTSGAAVEVLDVSEDTTDLEKWCAFHEAVRGLPAEEREVVGLIFYHGWDQAQVADLLQMSDRTVRRRWTSAMLKLREEICQGV